MKAMYETLSINHKNTVINYKLERRPRRKKSIAIAITPKDGVVVRAPVLARVKSINRFMEDKADWIIKSLENIKSIQEETKKDYVNGDCFALLGKDCHLIIEEAQIKRKVKAKLVGRKIIVRVPVCESEEQRIEWIRGSLGLFYLDRAEEVIEKAVRRLSIHIGRQPAKIKVKNLKSSWGICRENNLSFNWRLVMAPMSIIEYVVAHEICHLKHKDHSKNFWSMLEAVQPDYKDRKARLRKMGYLLEL